MQRSRCRISAVAAVALACALSALPRSAAAHPKTVAVREIVRVRGTVADGDGKCEGEAIDLRILGKGVRLCGSDVRRIAVAASETADAVPMPSVFEVHGERERLSEITAAAQGTRITLLGEWRPGRRDLFFIDLDLCACGQSSEP